MVPASSKASTACRMRQSLIRGCGLVRILGPSWTAGAATQRTPGREAEEQVMGSTATRHARSTTVLR